LTLLSNAYSLVPYEQNQMQDIDDRIRMSNPDAQILPIGSNPLLEGTLKEGFAKNRPLYNSDLS